MKHRFISKTLSVIALLATACATAGSGAAGGAASGVALSLMDAIEQTGEKIASELPAGSRVAFAAFESSSDNLSDYIMEELTGALFDRGIEVADRQNLEYVYKELDLQMSGDVSDESAKSVGKFLAADMVITGQLLNIGGTYRYRVSAISVETAVRASVTRLDVRGDADTRRMITAIANQKTTVKTAKYGVSADVTPRTAGAFLDRGIMFASKGEYDKAIADFTEALRLDPNMTAAYMMRGRVLHASVSRVIDVGDNFSSISTIGSSSITSSNSAVGGVGLSAAQTRALNLAIADFTTATWLEPDLAKAYSNRGMAYDDKGEYDRAIADFNQAIRIDPKYSAAYMNRGAIYAGKKDYDRAIADYNQVIRLKPPELAFCYVNRGNVYYFKKDYNRAIADYTQAIKLNPNIAEAYTNRGAAYMEKNDYNRAIADFGQAIRVDPNYAGAYNNRAIAYYNKKDYGRAIADWETALRLNPNLNVKEWIEEARRRQ